MILIVPMLSISQSLEKDTLQETSTYQEWMSKIPSDVKLIEIKQDNAFNFYYDYYWNVRPKLYEIINMYEKELGITSLILEERKKQGQDSILLYKNEAKENDLNKAIIEEQIKTINKKNKQINRLKPVAYICGTIVLVEVGVGTFLIINNLKN